MTACQSSVTVADGLTQASIVMSWTKRRAAISGTTTRAVVPLNDSAPPLWPAGLQVALTRVPELPPPESSATIVPVLSLHE